MISWYHHHSIIMTSISSPIPWQEDLPSQLSLGGTSSPSQGSLPEHCVECFMSCYLNKLFSFLGYISVSTIDLLGPGQHWENQQFKKRHLEKLESESKTNKTWTFVKMRLLCQYSWPWLQWWWCWWWRWWWPAQRALAAWQLRTGRGHVDHPMYDNNMTITIPIAITKTITITQGMMCCSSHALTNISKQRFDNLSSLIKILWNLRLKGGYQPHTDFS